MITWESICKAVEGMKTVPIKGKDYVQVTERVKAFRMICPCGCIATEIISLDENMVVMKTTVTDEDGKVLATGMAFERQDSSYINKTSYIENCETSSVGRALGWLAIGVDASMASAEELVNAIKGQERIKEREASNADVEATDRGIKVTKRLKEFGAQHGLDARQINNYKDIAIDNGFAPANKKWADYTDEELNTFLHFVEMNCHVGDA